MTEVELVANAFATGAASARTDSEPGPVRDLYAELRQAVRRRLATEDGPGRQGEGGGYQVGGGYGVRVLDAYETDPDVWRTRLIQVLTGAGAGADEEVLAAARAVLRAERRRGPLAAGLRGEGIGS